MEPKEGRTVLNRLRRRVTYGNVAATVALAVATAGFAAAVIPGPDGTIHACYRAKGGAVRVVDANTSCRRNERSVSWSQIGPRGEMGAQGESATTLWAIVDGATGSLIRGSHVVSTAKVSFGYEVIFDRDVSRCSYQATNGGAQAEDGQVGVGPRNGKPNGVFVLTQDNAGMQTDHSFNLAVFC
jgi:hypothetical protein